MKHKIILIVLFSFFIGNLDGQELKSIESQPAESYKYTIGWDMFSVNYSYAFVKKENWAAGISTGLGIGLIVSINRPYYWFTCIDCEGSSYQRINPILIENARVGLFVRYNYFKNNYIEVYPFLSSFLISGYSDAFLKKSAYLQESSFLFFMGGKG